MTITVVFLIFFRSEPSTSSGNKRLQQTQAQVNEVVGIMRVNVEKVLERDQKLSELDQRVSNNPWPTRTEFVTNKCPSRSRRTPCSTAPHNLNSRPAS